MRKAFIRLAVDLALAENGYSKGWYEWVKPGHLEVFDGIKVHKLHLPAGGRLKREGLISALSVLPAVGPPREAPMRVRIPKAEQTDLVALLDGVARRAEAA